MKLSTVTTLKNRSASLSKDGKMSNAFAEAKNGVLRAVKRPCLVATFSALEGGAGSGQGLFAYSTPEGEQTLVGIQNDVLNNSPTPVTTTLRFTVQPVDWKIATAMSPSVVVTAYDSFGNVMTSFTGAVTISFSANPNGGTLSGTLSVNAVSGVATFSNLKIDRVGGGYKLSATGTRLKSATSRVFKIISNLSFTVQPSGGQPNVTLDPVEVSIVDASSGTISGYTGDVTVALASGPGTLSGTLTVSAVNGVASFANLEIDTNGTYTLVASASNGGLANVTSNSFVIAVVMVFTTQPANTTPGATMADVVVTVRDGAGSTITTFTGNVTVAILNNPSGGVLSGTLTVAAVSGVATFSTLSINIAGTGYTLQATSTGIANVTSAAFNIITGSVTAINLDSNQIFGYSDSLNLLDGTGSPPTVISTTGGSILPATFGGKTIGALAYNPNTGITSFVINDNVNQLFFLTIDINGSGPIPSASGYFDQQGGKTAWGWFLGAAIPSAGTFSVEIL